MNCLKSSLGMIVLVALLMQGGAAADIHSFAVRVHDLDEAACQTFHNGEVIPVDFNRLCNALGLDEGRDAWVAGVADGQRHTFHYRVALLEPTAIGSVMSSLGRVRLLKADAPYPGDPDNDDHWLDPEIPPRQAGSRLGILPPGFTTRAVLVTDIRTRGRSQLNFLRLFERRLHNITPTGFANADTEYTVYPFASPPRTFAAADIVRGRTPWINSGENERGQNLRPPISTIHPSWFVLSWLDPQEFNGIWLNDNFVEYELYYYVGSAGINPAAAAQREWRRIRDLKERVSGGTRWISFNPIETRGLKITILKASSRDRTSIMDSQVATINGYHVHRDLGDEPVPEYKPAAAELPPLAIPYEIEETGKVTMVIDGPDGTRVRNLTALEQREAGKSTEYWNLKNEQGQFVEPGTYTWKAITHPPLELRYQMTAYPNVSTNSPHNTPWLNGHSGAGGWMADHTPSKTVATAGDRVYFGAPTAESGVSTIECDLEGNKLWGHHSFASWTGPEQMAADSKYLYVAADARGIMAYQTIDPSTELVWTVDTETKAVREMIRMPPTSTRKRGLQSIAAGDGNLYLSIDGKNEWLVNAAGTGDVDIENSLPRYIQRRKERYPHEVVPDPRNDFVRLFRLHLTPPSCPAGGLTYLETTRGPAKSQHIVLALNREVPLGSIVYPVPQDKDIAIRISVLKPNGKYPPDPEDNSQWIDFDNSGSKIWDAVPAPPNTLTRALRITMTKGADDIFTQVDDLGHMGGGLDALLQADDSDSDDTRAAWQGQLEGMKLLRRRYVNVTEGSTVRVNSGTLFPDGSWDAERPDDRPLSIADPGIYVMEWEKPQEMRGLAIKEIDGRLTEVDIYTGPDNQPIDIENDEHWKKVATYQQQLRYLYSASQQFNPHARYLDGYVDLGPNIKTRAVRLRVVEQWLSRHGRPWGVRVDRGGATLDPRRCRVYGVAALQYIGGEVPVDPLIYERVEVVDPEAGKITKEFFVETPGAAALSPDGHLYLVSKQTMIVRLNTEDGSYEPFITDDLVRPQALAFDSNGHLYVFDNAPDRKVVRVYDTEGNYVRHIGQPGGHVAGPWTGQTFENVHSMAIDRNDQLWLVDWNYWPKRISQWNALDGTLTREFLGNTQYGGGGVLDPYNKSRVFYRPLEFELDWETGETRLKNITWRGNSEAGEVPINLNDHTYMVTRPEMQNHPCGVVYIHDGDKLRRVAAVGIANDFPPLRKPEILKMLGGKGLLDYVFMWSDLNGDGDVQSDEVTLIPRPSWYRALTNFNRDLSIQAGTHRYEVKEFLPDGTPIYELTEYPDLVGQYLYRLNDGTFFRRGDGNRFTQAGLTEDGRAMWNWTTEGDGVHGYHKAKPFFPGQVVSEFGFIGHEEAHEGDLGEFVVFNTNAGTWNVWTSDGMLAAKIFRERRESEAESWSMTEHYRDMRIDDVTAGSEHFQGYFGRTFEDDKYYVVAGHNHVSMVEIGGIEKFRRHSGSFTVEPDDLRNAVAFDLEQQKNAVYEQAKIIDCFRRDRTIRIDGRTDDWQAPSAELDTEDAKFYITYDDQFLYVCFETKGMGPLRNTGEQWDRLFKTGASVDLQMSVDKEADPQRKAPVKGDFRLLMTVQNNRPIAVLYKPVEPGASEDQFMQVTSPLWTVTFDQVKVLQDVRMAHRGDADSYVLEAAIPLQSIGLRLEPNLRLKLDWGILVSGRDGSEVIRRVYWSNKATLITADAPSEAILRPDLWGMIRFGHTDQATLNPLDPTGFQKQDDSDLLDELEEELFGL